MEILRHAYPYLPQFVLKQTLDNTKGDVFIALELLRLNADQLARDFRMRGKEVGPDLPTLLSNYTMQEGDRYAMERKPPKGVAERDWFELMTSVLQTWIVVRELFPNITRGYIRQQIEQWPEPRPRNIAELIIQRLLEPENDLGDDFGHGTLVQTSEKFIECGCCFTECEAKTAIRCGSRTSLHQFCLDCTRRYAEVEIGNGRTELKCMDGSGCKELFTEPEIRRFLDQKRYAALEKLRRNNDLRDANLEGLVHCLFCDFAAILDDPEVTIFECQNFDSCGKRSCRNCQVESHHPMSCEQFQKGKASKHAVEEAMTAALLKKCNRCNKPFLKEDGCNKMKCPCGNVQCYICSTNISGYDHFDRPSQCPLYDNTAERQRQEVAAAQGRAVLQILERYGITEADLIVDKDLMNEIKDDERERRERREKRQRQLMLWAQAWQARAYD